MYPRPALNSLPSQGQAPIADLPASSSPGLGLQAFATMPGTLSFILNKLLFVLRCLLCDHLTVFLLGRKKNPRTHMECWTFWKEVTQR